MSDSPLQNQNGIRSTASHHLDSSPKKGATSISNLNAAGARMGGRANVLKPRLMEKEESLPNATEGMMASVKKDWEGPVGSTSAAGSKSSSGRGDRYIANRDISRANSLTANSLSDLDLTGTSGSSSRPSSSDGHSRTESNIAQANQDVESSLSDLALSGGEAGSVGISGVQSGQRILSFSAAPPSSAFGGDGRSRIASSKPKNHTLPSSLTSGGRRRIGATPLKTLDAPGIGDDFYFNLMDWSSTGLIAIGLSSCCYVWDSETGETNEVVDIQTLKSSLGGGPGSCITSVKWDSEGNHLAIGTDMGFTQLYDISTLQRTRTLKPTSIEEFGGGPDSLKVNVMSWANDGTFDQGFHSGLIREHDVRIRESITKNFQDAHSGQVVGLEWREDSNLLASGGNDNVVKVWDRRSDTPKMKKENHTAAVKALAWCPWQPSILATGGGTNDHTIHFWNVTQNARVNSIECDSQVTSLIWSPNYREIMSSHGHSPASSQSPDPSLGSCSINLWSYPSCSKIHQIENAHDGRILKSNLSPNGQLVATVGSDENLKIWNMFEKVDDGKNGKKDDGINGVINGGSGRSNANSYQLR